MRQTTTASLTKEGRMPGGCSLRAAALLVLLVATAPPVLRAAEGRIPVWEPVVITQPGSYVVTRDITALSGPVLEIRVGGVSVDLNGHTLAVSNQADPVVKIASVMGIDPQPFQVANGRIQGGMYGIQAVAGINPCCRFTDLTLGGQAAAGVSMASLGDLEATGIVVVDTKTAFDLTGAHPPPDDIRPTAVIRASRLHADVGVACDGVACSVLDSTITSCGTGVWLVGADGSVVARNGLSKPAGGACFTPPPDDNRTIHLEGSCGVRITGNTLQGLATVTGSNHGITADAASHDAVIGDNLITGFGDDGLHLLGSGHLVRNNQITRNLGHGIWLGGENALLDGVKITENGRDGIVFTTAGNVYRGCVLLGNANPVSGAGLPDTLDGGGNIP